MNWIESYCIVALIAIAVLLLPLPAQLREEDKKKLYDPVYRIMFYSGIRKWRLLSIWMFMMAGWYILLLLIPDDQSSADFRWNIIILCVVFAMISQVFLWWHRSTYLVSDGKVIIYVVRGVEKCRIECEDIKEVKEVSCGYSDECDYEVNMKDDRSYRLIIPIKELMRDNFYEWRKKDRLYYTLGTLLSPVLAIAGVYLLLLLRYGIGCLFNMNLWRT